MNIFRLLCMPLYALISVFIAYTLPKTGSAIYVDVDGEREYGIYQADGTILVSLRQADGTYIKRALRENGTWV